MKCQAEILLLKNKLRLMKGTLRHAWQPLLGFLIVGVALAYQLILWLLKPDAERQFLRKGFSMFCWPW